jgi:hypothetical protein
VPLAVVSVIGVVVTAWVIGRDLWFFSDDWNIFANYHSGNLLEPFNGHLSLFPAGVYQALFHTLGVGSYWPYRLFGLLGYALLGFVVLRFTRRRAGDVAALLAVTAVMWSSAATTNVMFPFLVNYSLPIACLVAVWDALDRGSRRAEVEGSLWLTLALATSGLGLMVAAALAVELAWTRAPLRRWLTYAPGPILWLAWYVGHRNATPITHDVGEALRYGARMFLGGTTALAAGWKPGGWALAIAFAVLVVASIVWRTFDARALGALVAPLAFIGTTALTRTAIVPPIPPDEVRYRWAVAAYVVLAVVIMWRRDRIPVGATARTVAACTAGAVLVVGGVRLVDGTSSADGVNGMRNWTDLVVGNEPGLRAVTVAVESVPRPANPNQRLPLSFVKITAAGYLGAVRDVGSPNAGYRFTDRGGHHDQVTFADHYLIEQSRTSVRPLPSDLTCTTAPTNTAPAGSSVLVDTRRATQPGALRIARFGTIPDAPIVPLPRSTVGVIRLPADPSYVDARALDYRFAAPAGVSLRVCS